MRLRALAWVFSYDYILDRAAGMSMLISAPSDVNMLLKIRQERRLPVFLHKVFAMFKS
jgi:hypothetical protein